MTDDMSDRKLLELAAKAVGLVDVDGTDREWAEDGKGAVHGPFKYFDGASYFYKWNPIEDDGDSRYAEVALDLTVTQDGGMACVWALDGVGKSGEARIFEHYEPYINHAGDKLAATRFAVFAVAVEIGKAMP